jgi:hypothetical protein
MALLLSSTLLLIVAHFRLGHDQTTTSDEYYSWQKLRIDMVCALICIGLGAWYLFGYDMAGLLGQAIDVITYWTLTIGCAVLALVLQLELLVNE